MNYKMNRNKQERKFLYNWSRFGYEVETGSLETKNRNNSCYQTTSFSPCFWFLRQDKSAFANKFVEIIVTIIFM